MKGFRTLALSAAICVPTTAVVGQTCFYYPDGKLNTGVSSTVPFGAKDRNNTKLANQYVQFIVPGSHFGTKPVRIRSIGFVPKTDRTHYFGAVSVNLQHTTLTKPTTFFLGNGSGRHVSGRHDAVDWVMKGGVWNRIPIDYTFDPSSRNLLVSIYVFRGESMGTGDAGFLSDATIDTAYRNGFAFGTGNFGVLSKGAPKIEFCVDAPITSVFDDSGCKGTNGKVPKLRVTGSPSLGKAFQMTLEDAISGNGLAVLVWSWRGLGWTLPGGCTLRPTPDFVNGVPTVNGKASFPLAVPNDTALLNGVPLVFQYYAHDPKASSLGFAGSNWALLQIGR